MAIADIIAGVKAGSQQSDNLGKELRARRDMNEIGRQALKGSDSAPAPVSRSKPAGDVINPKAQYGDKSGEKRIDTATMTRPLGSFKKGGKVKKTGVYKLHKGERVMNAKQTRKMENKGGMAAALAGDNDGDE